MSLFDTIYQQIGESSVQQLANKLPLGQSRLVPMVDQGIRLISDGLSSVAQTEEGRQKLYESIRYTDDSVVDYPETLFAEKSVEEAFAAGNDTLVKLIGPQAAEQVAETLTSKLGGNQQESEKVIGYLVPEVLGSLKREIDRGNVLDSADGIGQLFFGNGAPPLATGVKVAEENSAQNLAKSSSLKVRDTGATPGSTLESSSTTTSTDTSSTDTSSAAAAVMPASTAGSASDNSVSTSTTAITSADAPRLGAAAASTKIKVPGPAAGNAGVRGAANVGAVQNGGGGSNPVRTQSTTVAADAIHDEGGDWSWLFRYALPVLLMGGLMIGGLKNCGGDMSSSTVLPLAVDVEPSDTELEALASVEALQSELAAAQESAQAKITESETRITALESEVEKSNAEKAEALAKLDEVSKQLEQSPGTQQDTTELSALLSSMTSERDTAAEQLSLFQSQLDQSAAEKDSALAEIAQLKEQLADVQSSTETSDASQLKRELEGMTAENNVNREAFKRLNVELQDVKAALAASEKSKAELEAASTNTAVAGATANEETDLAKAELEAARADAEAIKAELETSQSDLQAAKTELEAASASMEAALADHQEQLKSSEEIRLSYQDEIDRLKTQLENTVAAANRDMANTQAESQQLLSGAEQDRDALVEEISSLTETKGKLEEQLDQYAVELAMASDGVTELQAKLSVAEKELADTRSELVTNLSLRDGFETQILDLESKLDTAKQSSSSDINRLTSVAGDLQGQLDLMMGARDEAQTGIAKRDAQIDELASRVEELQASLDSAVAETEKSQADNAGLQQTIDALKASADTMATEVEQAASMIESAELKVTELEAELNNSGDQIVKLTGERDDLLNQKAQLNEALSAVSAERDEIKAATGQLDNQVSDLTARLEQATAQSQDSESRLSALNASLTDAQSQLALSASDAGKYEKQTELLAEETVRYQSEITALRQERDQLTAELAALDSQLGTLKNEVDVAESAMVNAQQSETESVRRATLAEKNIDGLNKEIVRLKQDHQAAVTELEQTLNDLRADRDDAMSESAAAVARVASFDEEKSQLTGTISDLQSSFDNSQDDIASLTNRISTLETELEALNSARDGAQAEADALRDEVADATLRIAELTGLADGYKQTLDQADEARRAEVESIKAIRDAIAGRLSEVDVDDVDVITRDNNTAVGITIGSGNLFRAGSADLSRDGSEVLAKVGGIVADYGDWKIDVEGHTDNQPIGGVLKERYPSNWELSVARASSAVRFLQVESGIDPTLLSAKGFGETQPLDADDTPEARRKNRRVEVVLRKQ